jgi:uncharacterized membrane protein
LPRQHFQRLDKKKVTVDSLRAELAWAMVRVAREEVSKAEEGVKTLLNNIETCEAKIEEETEKQREKKLQKVKKQFKPFPETISPTPKN